MVPWKILWICGAYANFTMDLYTALILRNYILLLTLNHMYNILQYF